ncbi:MAG: EAL domain-containing protein [Mycobacterium sp.]
MALSLAIDSVRPLFQPILWLDTLSIAGYESLARCAEGLPFAEPTDLLAAARCAGRISELDATMSRRSIEALTDVDWHPTQTLFGNVDAEAIISRPDPLTMDTLDRAAAAGLRVVVEITERSPLANPGALIEALTHVRSQGWGVAVDDVGAEEDSLALLAILQPDVVKLDKSILHCPVDTHIARIRTVTRLYCDRTGALMVCEGVETQAHEARARALGADLVQGVRYGAAEPLPIATGSVDQPVRLLGNDVREEATLAQRLSSIPEAALPATQIIDAVSELLAIAARSGRSAVVIATAPGITHIAADSLAHLAGALPYSALVALFAPGCRTQPAAGVHGIDASMEEQLGSAWSLTVVAETLAVSILAGRRGANLNDPVPHRIVHDHATVTQILRLLVANIR